MAQKGPIPEKIVSDNYPLDKREAQYQRETGSPKAFEVASQVMPTITLEVKQSGKIGTASPVTTRPLREPINDSNSNPETNLRMQFVKPNEFEHSEGAFNK